MPTSTEPSSIDGIINGLYAALSFSAGARPDFGRFGQLFGPGARLIKVTGGQSEVMDVNEFVRRIEVSIGTGQIDGSYERELERRTDVFGAIAQIFGTFERQAGDGSVRGINAIQLRNDGNRWWIESLMWADERDDLPLPDNYLPRGDEVKKRRRARTLRTQPYGAPSSR